MVFIGDSIGRCVGRGGNTRRDRRRVHLPYLSFFSFLPQKRNAGEATHKAFDVGFPMDVSRGLEAFESVV